MQLLSPIERNQLLTQHKQERDGRIRDRLKVILWTDEGWSVDEIAKALFIQPSTVGTHLQEYAQSKKLKPESGGSLSKLTAAQTKDFIVHLEQVTYATVAEIVKYLKEKYGKSYSISGLTDWLRQQGFTYKKFKGVPSKADKQKQAAFIASYKTLEKELPIDEEIIFIDSAHPTQATKLGYGWVKKGKEKEIKTTASRSRVNITGGVNIKTREVVSATYPTINTESTIAFFKQLSSSYPSSKKLHVILDGAGYHRSKELQDYVKSTKITLHYLPPYSPNLNPIERLWKIMNEYARNNRHFTTAKEFRDAIGEFFSETIPKIPEVLNSRITSNFQLLKDVL